MKGEAANKQKKRHEQPSTTTKDELLAALRESGVGADATFSDAAAACRETFAAVPAGLARQTFAEYVAKRAKEDKERQEARRRRADADFLDMLRQHDDGKKIPRNAAHLQLLFRDDPRYHALDDDDARRKDLLQDFKDQRKANRRQDRRRTHTHHRRHN